MIFNKEEFLGEVPMNRDGECVQVKILTNKHGEYIDIRKYYTKNTSEGSILIPTKKGIMVTKEQAKEVFKIVSGLDEL